MLQTQWVIKPLKSRRAASWSSQILSDNTLKHVKDFKTPIWVEDQRLTEDVCWTKQINPENECNATYNGIISHLHQEMTAM